MGCFGFRWCGSFWAPLAWVVWGSVCSWAPPLRLPPPPLPTRESFAPQTALPIVLRRHAPETARCRAPPPLTLQSRSLVASLTQSLWTPGPHNFAPPTRGHLRAFAAKRDHLHTPGLEARLCSSPPLAVAIASDSLDIAIAIAIFRIAIAIARIAIAIAIASRPWPGRPIAIARIAIAIAIAGPAYSMPVALAFSGFRSSWR